MTKKHYAKIAATINARFEAAARESDSDSETCNAIRVLALALADDFDGFDPNFDRVRFLAACQVE
jgi:hypothetical protein